MDGLSSSPPRKYQKNSRKKRTPRKGYLDHDERSPSPPRRAITTRKKKQKSPPPPPPPVKIKPKVQKNLSYFVKSQEKKVARIQKDCSEVYNSVNKDTIKAMWIKTLNKSYILCSDFPAHFNRSIIQKFNAIVQSFTEYDFYVYYYICYYYENILEDSSYFPKLSWFHIPKNLPPLNIFLLESLFYDYNLSKPSSDKVNYIDLYEKVRYHVIFSLVEDPNKLAILLCSFDLLIIYYRLAFSYTRNLLSFNLTSYDMLNYSFLQFLHSNSFLPTPMKDFSTIIICSFDPTDLIYFAEEELDDIQKLFFNNLSLSEEDDKILKIFHTIIWHLE